ncbi:hypothetical protein FRB90_003011 [Tulasnella sp. 427]|nr:hypothetical protein FRB90_003011 [Tulasnella sp. 427]
MQTSKTDRTKVIHYVDRTLTIIPRDPSITVEVIENVIRPFQAVLIEDEEKGVFWARSIDISTEALLARFNSASKGRFACREVGGDRRDPDEKSRLLRALESAVHSKPDHQPSDPDQGSPTFPFDDLLLGASPAEISSLFPTPEEGYITATLDVTPSSDEKVAVEGKTQASSSLPLIGSSGVDSAEPSLSAIGSNEENDRQVPRGRPGSPPRKKMRVSASPEPSQQPDQNVVVSRGSTLPSAAAAPPASSASTPSSSASFFHSRETTPHRSPSPTPSTDPSSGSSSSAPSASSVPTTTLSDPQPAQPPLPTFEAVMEEVPPPSSASFDFIPVEIIAEIAQIRLAREKDPDQYVQILSWFYRLSPHSRRAVTMLPHLWRVLHPTCSSHFTKYILQSSQLPISIYYTPQPRPTKRWQRFPQFFKVVKPEHCRWKTVDVTIEPGDLNSLLDTLDSEELPLLTWISISISGSPVQSSPPENMDSDVATLPRPFTLPLCPNQLVKSINLHNLNVDFDPITFVNLSGLYLSDGVRVSYEQLLSWLGIGARNVENLHLYNVHWQDILAAPDPETAPAFLLGRLTDITLVEETAESGLTNLLYYLSIPQCVSLQLQSLSVEDFVEDRLAPTIFPILRKTILEQPSTRVNVFVKPTRSEIYWVAGDNLHDDNPFGAGFHVGHKDPSGPGVPYRFLRFVRNVADRLAERPTITLVIEDACSGQEDPDLEPGQHLLLAEEFEPIMMDVKTMWGKVIRGHLNYLRDLLSMWAPVSQGGVRATFPHLSWVHLEYLPDGTLPSVFSRLSLEEMVQALAPFYGEIQIEENDSEGFVDIKFPGIPILHTDPTVV